MLQNVVDVVNIAFMIYIFIFAFIFFISTITSIVTLFDAIMKRRFHNQININKSINYIPISILVPAYNEHKTIIETINSLLNVDYPTYEIIIINDGSSDNTAQVLIDQFKMQQINKPIRKALRSKNEVSVYEIFDKVKITLINKENGGKSDALNLGINASKYPYFVTMDADSILQKDSLQNIVVPFLENDKTVAVGGNIKVANQVQIKDGVVTDILRPKKTAVIFQIIEYYRVFLTTRIWFSNFNGTMIVSGAFGLFKKSAVINVGGYDVQTIGEDMGLVVKLHSYHLKNKIDYLIKYEPFAICWSQVPTNFKDLKSQRARWHVGLMQSILDHKYIFLNPRYREIGLFNFIYLTFFEMLSSLIEIFGLVFITVALFTGYMNTLFFFLIIGFYLVYSFIITSAAIFLELVVFKSKIKLSILIELFIFSLLEPFGYRQLISFYRLIGIFKYYSKDNKWGNIKRYAQN